MHEAKGHEVAHPDQLASTNTGPAREHATHQAQEGSPLTPAPHIHKPTPGTAGEEHAHHSGQASMIADYRRRFWVSLVLTMPILLLSGQIQQWLEEMRDTSHISERCQGAAGRANG